MGPLTLEELPERFERSYRKTRVWREQRGFTEAQAGRYMLALSRKRSGG
jgi:hypothetical protein